MFSELAKWKLNSLLKFAGTGVEIDGKNLWDIQVHSPDFYSRVKWQGRLGLGESYMDGLWDCSRLDEFFCRLMSARIHEQIGFSLPLLIAFAREKFLNLQAVKRAFKVGRQHYDLGNDFFEAWLGKTMAYTCGYWQGADNLDDAQFAKFDLVCRKLGVKRGQRLLDIGCGWGGFAKFAAENYGAKVVGITNSAEQAKFSRNLCNGLPVEIRFHDYRLLKEKGTFDFVTAIGLYEHIGSKNYRVLLKIIKDCLKPGGLHLAHFIGKLKPGVTDPWFDKYIFPNSKLPALAQVLGSAEGLFVVEDVHNFGVDYDKTLMTWDQKFVAAWPVFKDKYGDRFYRMWRYYLLSCAGAFRARVLQLWQVVLSPNGVQGGYKSVR